MTSALADGDAGTCDAIPASGVFAFTPNGRMAYVAAQPDNLLTPV